MISEFSTMTDLLSLLLLPWMYSLSITNLLPYMPELLPFDYLKSYFTSCSIYEYSYLLPNVEEIRFKVIIKRE